VNDDPPEMNSIFDINCRRCPRLAAFLETVQSAEPDYFCRPVPPFGDPQARLLIVGLAPGMHGANRTGRPFTGDHAGILLYATLHKFGLASAAVSTAADDGLQLLDARITNSVKCLPPGNKPLPLEIKVCNDFLRAELEESHPVRAILALGAIAHAAVLRALGLPAAGFRFAHAAEHALPGARVLVDSYHCSRYNTNTRRLTTPMFEAVVGRARELAFADA
jgi:uracil-DNA glycosylase family 4